MKKLIALSAAAVMASSAAMADVAISGSASIIYDDNGSGATSTTYDADLGIVGTVGGSTLTVNWDLDSNSVTAVDLASTIGPVTIGADMINNDTACDRDTCHLAATASGGSRVDSDERAITVALDVPVGDVTIAVDDSGDLTLTGTTAGVTISHTAGSLDSTTISASIAGVDVSVTRAESSTTALSTAGTDCTATDGAACGSKATTAALVTSHKGATTVSSSTTWTLATTVSGVALTLNSASDVTATMGLAGNTLTIAHYSKDALAAEDYNNYNAIAVAAYSTVAITRDLTSGATLTATYKSSDESLTLKAAVSF